MSSLSNINNSSSVVNIGRTTPVSPGAQPAAKSIPVVLASDQTAVPVVEQNKIQSEVALSLLGIPRSEVALGIFADVNTYDVNPVEWSASPSEYVTGNGIKHLPDEAGALVQAGKNQIAVLTSKRFFRYQPGRVSAATFGVKSTVSPTADYENGIYDLNPSIRKFGIFDKFDGYYWETNKDGTGDNFCVVRRTQSLLKFIPIEFGSAAGQQSIDYGTAGKIPNTTDAEYNQYPTATKLLIDNRFTLAESAYATSGVSAVANAIKCKRDVGYFIDGVTYDITLNTNYNATFLALAEVNSAEYPLNSNVTSAIAATQTQLKALSNVDATADSRVDSFFNRVSAIAVDSGTRVDKTDDTQARQIAFAKGVTFTNPTTGATSSQIAVKELLIANRDFITAEINAWVDDPAQGDFGHTTITRDKCTRDVLYLLNAFIYDMLYGGNSATYDATKFFFYDGTAKTSDVHKAQTIAAYQRLKTILYYIVQRDTTNWTKTTGNSQTQSTTYATPANTEDALLLQSLVQILIDVLQTGPVALPTSKTSPSTSWAASSYTTAKSAIEAAKDVILSTVVPNATYTADDLKCLRDMDFAIDAYVADLQWGGNAHTIVNATTYQTALLPNAANETAVHTALRNALSNYLISNGQTAAADKIANTSTGLAKFMIYATGGTSNTFTNAQLQGTATLPGSTVYINFGRRSKVLTIFSIYKRYLGYLISNDPSFTYTTNAGTYTADELKYRCLRDVSYVVDGYARDLEYGGNSATVFNARSYYFDGIKVTSQTANGIPAEIARHTFLKNLLTSSSNVTVTKSSGATVAVPSVLTKFGLTSYKTRLDTLATLIVNNFTTPFIGAADFGTGGQFGDLVILRDNLIMIHAAVNDPSLLLPTKNVVVRIDPTNNTLEAAEGEFVPNQHVRFVGNAGGLVNNKIYRIKKVGGVSGTKSNIIKLVNPLDETDTIIDITSAGSGTQYIQPNVPFIFPNEYYVGKSTLQPGDKFLKPNGMFPYMYVDSEIDALPASVTAKPVGFIDTAIDTSTNAAELRAQIDRVNLAYNNWVKQNVDPKYYAVYEYRVPRSRFSQDQLNGTTNKVVYSDIAAFGGGKVYSGEPVQNADGSPLTATSAWNMDFTKVTMLKIEFSWYGAVGALFLAYVPVANGEARWVRVHHLRCSNQLKIPSLGNATLPITYLVYGGGDSSSVGIDNVPAGTYEGTGSQHIVKYGASYYIDGGDRGTVRLYSYSNDDPTPVYGARYQIGNVVQDDTYGTDSLGTYIDITPRQINQITFAKAVTFTNPTSGASASEIAIKDRIIANRDFITTEINAWVNVNYPSHDHNTYKCTRDVLYVCNAFMYDMLYGGNTATYDAAKFFFYDGIAKTTSIHKAQTIAAYGRLKDVLGYVVSGDAAGWTKSAGNTLIQDTTGNNATTGDTSTLQGLVQVIVDVITNGTSSLPGTKTAPDTTWAISSYTNARTAITTAKSALLNSIVPNTSDTKCRRDVGYVIDGVGYDITLGTNYNATFLALAEANSKEYPLNSNVLAAITASQSQIKALSNVDATADAAVDSFYTTFATIAINESTRVYDNQLPSDGTFFMGAKVITSSREDQNVEVIWVSNGKLYLNKSGLISLNDIQLIANRPSVIFGLRAKESILNQKGVGVRNRVQVYPTKLSTANLGNLPVKLKILKTPYFQPATATSGIFNLTTSYTITAANSPLPASSIAYLTADGDYVYGWFRATVGTSTGVSVFGRLYKQSGKIYFALLQTYSEAVTLLPSAPFLKEGRFTFDGTSLSAASESTQTKERLSSVFISSQIQCPVPGTGTEIASFFLQPGSDHFDLLSYFDYNKDYLSFPLTNQVESLYLTTDTPKPDQGAALTEISASLTWEEQ